MYQRILVHCVVNILFFANYLIDTNCPFVVATFSPEFFFAITWLDHKKTIFNNEFFWGSHGKATKTPTYKNNFTIKGEEYR